MKQATNAGPEVSSRLFTVSGMTLCADISDLLATYGDAAAKGFVVRSARTGDRIAFVPQGVDRDAEGEVVAYVYAPASLAPAGLRVMLFND